MKRCFSVRGTIEIDIEFDDGLLPDEEWRSYFYPIHTLKDLAKHLAWNLGVRHWPLSSLDGFADRPDSDARLIGVELVEWDEVEETSR